MLGSLSKLIDLVAREWHKIVFEHSRDRQNIGLDALSPILPVY